MPFVPAAGASVRIRYATAELLEPLLYQGKSETFRVPTGFVTDFASVPRILTGLVPRMGVYTLAAILHDWFCVHLAAGDCVVSARDADGIFRRVAREDGAGFVTRWTLWTGVRWGALANRHRRAGWWRDAPAVLAFTLAGLSVIGAAVAVLAAVLFWAVS